MELKEEFSRYKTTASGGGNAMELPARKLKVDNDPIDKCANCKTEEECRGCREKEVQNKKQNPVYKA